MSQKKIHRSDRIPAPIGPYSHAVEVNGMLFCSGQIPMDAKGAIVGTSAAEQAEKVMANIKALLEDTGYSFSNVVKTTIFLEDMADFQAVNQVYGQAFPENPPARSTIAVRTLPKNVKVEIEVIACKA